MTTVRSGFLVLAILWAILLPVATFAASRPALVPSDVGHALAFVVYRIGSVVCHQRPERSFHLFAVQMPVCARCTGIYVGAALMAIGMVFHKSREPVKKRSTAEAAGTAPALGRVDRSHVAPGLGPARRVLLVSVLPGAATLVYEWSTGQIPAHWVRATSGVPLGAAVAWIVCRAAPARREGM
jgi:hypothetical protein